MCGRFVTFVVQKRLRLSDDKYKPLNNNIGLGGVAYSPNQITLARIAPYETDGNAGRLA